MLNAQPFPDSLHQLSLLQGLHASIMRTPDKAAIVEGNLTVKYSEIGQILEGTLVLPLSERSACVISWLTANCRSSGLSSNAWQEDQLLLNCPGELSHRSLVVNLLSMVVGHGIFSRDSTCALPAPLNDAISVIAALTPLWLGGTLHLFEPGDAAGLCAAISSGRVNQAWFGSAETAKLSDHDQLDRPHPGFRGLICLGLPSKRAGQVLTDWVGIERTSAVTSGSPDGHWLIHPGLSVAGECYPGFFPDSAHKPFIESPSS